MTKWFLSNESSVRRLTPPGRNFFFGYYDKCPWNETEEKLLAGWTGVWGRQPEADDVLTVGYVDLKGDSKFHPLGETKAWNFQQGSMLQWLREGSGENVLFNVCSKGRAFGRVVHQDGSHAQDWEWPVYTVASNGQTAASVDFGRLAWLREGYGYAGVRTSYSHIPAPKEDGLRVFDTRTGHNSLIVNYAELAANILPRGDGAPHWIDHIEFNSRGDRLVFLHRWLAADGQMLTRVMVVNTDGAGLRCLLDCGSAGHGMWVDTYEYGIWGRRSNLTGTIRSKASSFWLPVHWGMRLARKVIPRTLKSRIHGDTFFVFDVRSGGVAARLDQVPHEFRGGHPTRHPTMKNYIVCDAILSTQGDRFLYLVSLETSHYLPLVALGHDPAVESPIRCDFHPRWDRQGRHVCIDCAEGEIRGMYQIDISSALPPP